MINVALPDRDVESYCLQKTAEAYAERGVAYFKNDCYDAALSELEAAMLLNQNLAYAYCARGALRGKLQDYIGAIQDFNRAIKLTNDYADAISNRALALALLGQNIFALTDFTCAIRLKPGPGLYVNRAHVLRELKMTDAAIDDCVTAIDIDASYSEAYFLLFDLSIDRQDYCSAIHYLTLQLQVESSMARAYYHRAFAHSKNGDEDRALKDLVEAARLAEQYQPMLARVLNTSFDHEPESKPEATRVVVQLPLLPFATQAMAR